jgi:polyisoprenoid-binding protein YceI
VSATAVAPARDPEAILQVPGSCAGYRVREQLADLPAQSDATGRTTSIQGSMTLTAAAAGLSVTAASLSVDVSTLASDSGMRDQRIHVIGLESDQFPHATFVLSSPIALPTTAASGQSFHVAATGAMTIHGTTQTVTIPLDARLSGSTVEVAGSITFPWSEFGMQAPSIGGFVSVTDMATLEFDVLLTHG